jgi:hypothetical protein
MQVIDKGVQGGGPFIDITFTYSVAIGPGSVVPVLEWWQGARLGKATDFKGSVEQWKCL